MNEVMLAECAKHMEANGLPIDHHIIADGRIRRYSSGRKDRTNEWYIAKYVFVGNKTILICNYGSWQLDVKYKYSSLDKNSFSPQELALTLNQIKKYQEELSAETKAYQHKVAKTAFNLWNFAHREVPLDDILPSSKFRKYERYLIKKQISAQSIRYGYNVYDRSASVVIPIYNIHGKIRSLQYIWVDDQDKTHKYFLPGGEKRGNFHIINNLPIKDSDPIMIAEGFATGASLYMASGLPVVVAFDAGNIERVIENISSNFGNEIIIAADADETGESSGVRVARKFGCKFIVPQFGHTKYDKDHKDFNDMYQSMGPKSVSDLISLTIKRGSHK